MQSDHEVERLKKVYSEYQSNPLKQAQWSSENLGNQVVLRERQDGILRLLKSHGFLPLDDKSILDIGCGNGDVLAGLVTLGAKSQNLYGVDLLPERIERSKRSYPDFHFHCLNAEDLGFPLSSFDLLLFFTVFSSILDENMRKHVALEAGRVLKKEGAILWYDFRYDNPSNPHVRGVTKREIQNLFPGYALFLQTLSFLPPLIRRFGNLAPIVYPFLSRIPILHTHHLGLLIKP